jgi:hypothetical protein
VVGGVRDRPSSVAFDEGDGGAAVGDNFADAQLEPLG